MKRRALGVRVSFAAAIIAIAYWRAPPVRGATETSAAPYNRSTAASYLDEREVWWQQWPHARRDHGTICISCHTQVPYAMVRPTLQHLLGETAMPAAEKIMMDNVENRVTHWSDMLPFYSDAVYGEGKAAQSHATEAIQNAIILTSYDEQQGHLRPVTRTALDNAWALQEKSGELAGGWVWQNFHLGPWEGEESGYQGAALFLLTVEGTPNHYANETAVREHVQQLEGFLHAHYAEQPVLNQMYVLWASGKIPGLLARPQRAALLQQIRNLQQPDGGWCLAAVDERERKDHTQQSTQSDGYATGLAVLALDAAGASRRDPAIMRGVKWLEASQDKTGMWVATSINKHRDPESEAGKFMSDTATAYAILALQKTGATDKQ